MQPRRVLVIDDEEDIRVIATVLLEMGGDFEILLAASGEEGIALAAREKPAGILLDYSMPGLDGAATLSRLREEPATRDTPIIFLTGKAHGESRAGLDLLDVDGVIAKPVDPLSFANEVTAILARGRKAAR
ncbi:MAG: response regulator [Gemmatimonadaceae bacterium]